MYKNILIPVDLTEDWTWVAAMPTAVEHARRGGGVLHVVTVTPAPYALASARQVLPDDYTERMTREARKRLEALVHAQVPAEVKSHVMVAQGAISRQILQEAERVGADLIVMASHNPKIADYLIGSNASHVVHHAKCSVLVVR